MSRKLDKASANLESAERTVDEWQAKAHKLVASLAEAEATVGASVLASGDVEGTTRRVADLRIQAEAANSTVVAAEAARDAAKREVLLAEAADLTAAAERLDREAEKHAARTCELLEALREHEGGDYVPLQPPGGSIASDLHHWTPRSQQLRISAGSARRKAESAERRAEDLAPAQQDRKPEPVRV